MFFSYDNIFIHMEIRKQSKLPRFHHASKSIKITVLASPEQQFQHSRSQSLSCSLAGEAWVRLKGLTWIRE